MTLEFPHPTSADPARITQANFAAVESTRNPKASWHFRLSMPSACRPSSSQPAEAPKPGDTAPRSLERWHRDVPPVDVEVHGMLLKGEIDPADWLDGCALLKDKTVLSRLPRSSPVGYVGDTVATWRVGDDVRVGRFFATKSGTRLFVVSCQTLAEHYPKLAEEFYATVSSFRSGEDAAEPFAEEMTKHGSDTPVAWTMMLPKSWNVQPDATGEDAVSFQADHFHDEPTTALVGKLAFCVVARSRAKKPSEIGNAYLDAVRDTGVEIQPREFVSEPERPPFAKSWYVRAPVTRDGVGGEVRVRVMLHERVWVLAGVLSPLRGDDPIAWMENKRALDVATTTMEVRPPS